ncbi:macrocin O-methyltransferase [Leptolyngbya sp. 'hensonii']|uniref:TylF/MycF/NovP-related O-methyltransferase n=1 Tax=Leptolyngbya sp. 'hensonii' TaxID=1922337 RepID=UPI000959BCF3|nr:TylF/MycF/NovP-related O-methyltransferase [Leptolyngbya sp. 'hensonii']OLP18611.1 macrocin O-methyltransferase [Leptolyngbya sp. 'hensonii']
MVIKSLIKTSLRRLNLQLSRVDAVQPPIHPEFPPDFSAAEIQMIQTARPYTMTSLERMYALIQAVKYISQHQIEGEIVECGVWRGGSMMLIANTLSAMQDQTRNLYLFDTFSGMAKPSDKDVSYEGLSALEIFTENHGNDSGSAWCYASLEEVKQILSQTHYDQQKIHFVPGKVEETIPQQAPEKIALLRLDTDWYESTRHELIHLFPRLSTHGVIIIDDYGFWQGARLAVDEYLEQNNLKILLNRIDDTGRIAVKL